MKDAENSTRIAELSTGPVEYRWEQSGAETVLFFHGGHMRAGLPVGEEVFRELGYSVLAPSRPGYGRTPLRADNSPEGFARATAELCAHLGIDRLAAVVAISAGGLTGLQLAAREPSLLDRLILQAAVGFERWPDRRTRVAGSTVFNPISESFTWSVLRALVRHLPRVGLRAILGSLSVHPAGRVLDRLTESERAELVELFSRMRSGRGFREDLRYGRQPPVLTISQPTLIIASSGDGAVPIEQAESLANAIDGAELAVLDTDSHLIWFGPGSSAVENRVRAFL